MDARRNIPKMDKVLSWPEIIGLAGISSRYAIREAVRNSLSDIRRRIQYNQTSEVSRQQIISLVEQQLRKMDTPSIKRVINGTGIVIHTNLGRSPLASAAESALLNVSSGYSNLELSLEDGERGERYSHIEGLLCRLTGAEAAIAVNNNAAALVLVLSALAKGREVIVSRGELVEIGGSFRIPDVLKQSSATLVEAGTTNCTRESDYRAAITSETALLLKVHPSNYAVVGFHSETDTATLASIAAEASIPLIVDSGSGTLIDLSKYGLEGEKTVREYILAGADVVTFSGDKLLGGPQAGLIVGKKHLLDRIKSHPLMRAVRIDKLTLAALEATLRIYQDERVAVTQIPALRMLTISLPELKLKAVRMLRRLRRILPSGIELSLVDGNSAPGGGSFPLMQIPTRLISISFPQTSPHRLEYLMRQASTPVMGRVNKEAFLLDIRTIDEAELQMLGNSISEVYGALK